MNRLAIQESAARRLSPAQLVALAHRARFHSVGLRVAHTDRGDAWRMGAAAPELREMVDQLLTLRVSVLDVGQLELGRDSDETRRHVLDLAGRLGARHVTAFAAPEASGSAIEEVFGALVEQAEPYQLIPLLALRPGTVVDTPESALAVNRRVGGATVLTVDCGREHRGDRVVVPGRGAAARIPPRARRGAGRADGGIRRRSARHPAGTRARRRRLEPAGDGRRHRPRRSGRPLVRA